MVTVCVTSRWPSNKSGPRNISGHSWLWGSSSNRLWARRAHDHFSHIAKGLGKRNSSTPGNPSNFWPERPGDIRVNKSTSSVYWFKTVLNMNEYEFNFNEWFLDWILKPGYAWYSSKLGTQEVLEVSVFSWILQIWDTAILQLSDFSSCQFLLLGGHPKQVSCRHHALTGKHSHEIIQS